MANKPFDYNIYRDLIAHHANLVFEDSRKDVTFVFVEAEISIKAHKCILEAVSPVFASMFSGNFAEKDEVKVTDVKPEAFQLLIR